MRAQRSLAPKANFDLDRVRPLEARTAAKGTRNQDLHGARADMGEEPQSTPARRSRLTSPTGDRPPESCALPGVTATRLQMVDARRRAGLVEERASSVISFAVQGCKAAHRSPCAQFWRRHN